jgi:hypothetical protein
MTNLHIRPTPAGLLARAGDWLAILMVGAWASGTAAARADETAALRERALAALERAGTMECVVAVRRSVPDGHWYANIGYYAERDRGSHIEEAGFEDGRNLAWLPGGQLLAVNLATGAIRELVNDPLGGVRDPFVEGDGRTILFSYRQGKSDHFHLFTIPAEGGEPRRLTDGGFDDIEPVRGPDGEILFVSTRCKRWVNCWATQVAIVHRCDPDGSNIRPISANVEHDNTPWLLPDGRVLFTRWEYVDRSQVDYHHLWTMRPDGTGQTVFFGNQRPGIVMIDAKPVPGSPLIAAIFSPGHGQRDHNGALALIDPRRGPDDHSAARVVCGDNNLRDPWPLAEDLFVVARGCEVLAVDGGGRSAVLWSLPKDRRAGGFQVHEPRPLMPAAAAHRLPELAGEPAGNGRLVLADARAGRNMEGVGPGEIKKLLVLESLPKPINFTGGMEPLTYGGSFTLERVLGTVPVEGDGSAYFEVPPLRSLILVALDENDLAVKRMQSFLSVMPGETQSCVGCHEQRTGTMLPPRELAALARPASLIEPVAGQPDVFDFPRDIQPVLDRHCLPCHGYEAGERGGPYAGGVMLAGDRGPLYSHAYFTLTTRALFSDGRNQAKSNYAPRQLGSAASRLLKLLAGGHHEVAASAEEITRVRLWIESGAPYPGTYAALGSGMIGGYAMNRQFETDWDWPAGGPARQVLEQRCASCHHGEMALPQSLSDERQMSFWRFPQQDPRHRVNRHIVFNLSKPGHSLLLLAPTAPAAGGFGICKTREGEPAPVFTTRDDPGYQALLALIAAGRDRLNEITRFDMPQFRPRPEYLREMRRFGILPDSFDPAAPGPVDPYDLDQRYWRSLWHRPDDD